ncbi:MAG TPA: S41 family peptidase [Solirubrobacteraceae bacterium]|nr:S41 family peptidase [Solirubrobacteraceae bacterium]
MITSPEPLAQFRERAAAEDARRMRGEVPESADDDRTPEERVAALLGDLETVVRTAEDLVRDFYVHHQLKRAMHGADPLGPLRLLRQRVQADVRRLPALPELSLREFQDELLAIFADLRDRHTTCWMPKPYRGMLATLGVRIQAATDGERRFIVTEVVGNWPGDARAAVPLGAEITHFNDVPIARAVTLNARQTGGGSPDAYVARGLALLTDRPLTFVPLPNEDEVRLRFLHDGATGEVVRAWAVEERPVERDPTDRIAIDGLAYGRAIDWITRTTQNARFERYERVERVPARPAPSGVPYVADGTTDEGVTAAHRDKLKYGQALDDVGYVRIYSFDVDDVTGFVFDVIGILDRLDASRGLILDLRGNGGGTLAAAERLLQLFTPGEVAPQSLFFSATDGTRRICATAKPPIGRWRSSLDRARTTGVMASAELPLSDHHVESCNEIGQRHFAGLVVVVDALSYSATEVFAAGVQDHGCGVVLGTDGATGGGGGNPWSLNCLESWLEPYRRVPEEYSFDIAVRATTRVAAQAGQPVEGFGVAPKVVHPLTRRDVEGTNEDLIAHALRLLDEQFEATGPRSLDVALPEGEYEDGTVTLTVTAEGVADVDVVLDGRAVQSRAPLEGKGAELRFTAAPDLRHELHVLGYDGAGALVASRRLRFGRGRRAPTVPPPRPGQAPTLPRPVSKEEQVQEGNIDAKLEELEGLPPEKIGKLLHDEIEAAVDQLTLRLRSVLRYEEERLNRVEVTRRIEDAIDSLEQLDNVATNRWKDSGTNRWFGAY